jgi:hypothetical protein
VLAVGIIFLLRGASQWRHGNPVYAVFLWFWGALPLAFGVVGAFAALVPSIGTVTNFLRVNEYHRALRTGAGVTLTLGGLLGFEFGDEDWKVILGLMAAGCGSIMLWSPFRRR